MRTMISQPDVLLFLIRGHNNISKVSSISLSLVRFHSPILMGFDQHLILDGFRFIPGLSPILYVVPCLLAW